MGMKDKIWDVLPKLKKIREEKERRRKEQERAARIEDLFKILHRVGDVELPIPNLFAKTMLERHFGGLENINIGDDEQLMTIVWFLKHQNRIEIASLSREAILREVRQMMTEVPASHVNQYRQCVEEIFLAIQKKMLVDQQAILQEVIRILEDGEKSSSA